MNSYIPRVLIVDDESTLLFSLSDYLTFRGCQVDCADGMLDAAALVRHLYYDTVLIGVSELNVDQARALARSVREQYPQTRLIALASELAPLTDDVGQPMEFHQLLGRHLPLSQLARILCRCIAA